MGRNTEVSQKIKDAMEVVRKAGYIVIPRERVQQLEVNCMIDNAALYQYGRDKSDYMKHVHTTLYRELGHGLQGSSLAQITSENIKETRERFSPGGHTRFNLRLAVLPYDYAEDWFLTEIKKMENGNVA